VLDLKIEGDDKNLAGFRLHIQRQTREMMELVSDSTYFLSEGPSGGQLLRPLKETFGLGELPDLTIMKVEVKKILEWVYAIRRYILRRRLVVSVGRLSRSVLITASIESGWRTQAEWSDEAESEELAAWNLVTRVRGVEEAR
jgi:hypothetical protein